MVKYSDYSADAHIHMIRIICWQLLKNKPLPDDSKITNVNHLYYDAFKWFSNKANAIHEVHHWSGNEKLKPRYNMK